MEDEMGGAYSAHRGDSNEYRGVLKLHQGVFCSYELHASSRMLLAHGTEATCSFDILGADE
jgi:hypothetical protein